MDLLKHIFCSFTKDCVKPWLYQGICPIKVAYQCHIVSVLLSLSLKTYESFSQYKTLKNFTLVSFLCLSLTAKRYFRNKAEYLHKFEYHVKCKEQSLRNFTEACLGLYQTVKSKGISQVRQSFLSLLSLLLFSPSQWID